MSPSPQPPSTNRLADSTSPYLRAHAHQPVDWHPWGEEAFEHARRSSRPVFLSIGYSACHWCHVQSHESFEDPETARLLNELFVSIKVDREERPDIDRIHQIAQAMLTQRGGGWPLSMFLSPEDRRPFFGGTYFPPEPRHGLPGFKEVLTRVAQYYRERHEELRLQGDALMGAFAQLDAVAPAGAVPLDDTPLTLLRAQLESRYDAADGGFGDAPKFPQPWILAQLLRDAGGRVDGTAADAAAREMALHSLRQMAAGGLQDHLAGGFFRYSVDRRWEIPHFEKMLYDNAALLPLYALAGARTGDEFLTLTAQRCADWVLTEMQSPAGGFYCSFDADSEGHEGRYYVWDREEVRQALTAGEYEGFAAQYGLAGPANFEGRWHLRLVPPAGLHDPLIESARVKLAAVRSRRVPPALDDKILTSWNALMIRGLAIASRLLAREDLERSATRALDFVRQTLLKDGRLLATCREGRAHLAAYLDDYVFLADAILALQQVRFRQDELALASQLMDTVLEHFEDRETGGFYFTADDHEKLFHRSLSFGDESTPSGNGVAASVLTRLGHLLGETRYLDAAEHTLKAAWSRMLKDPAGHATLLTALAEWLSPPEVIILRGNADEVRRWREALDSRHAPDRLVLAIPSDAEHLPEALATKVVRDTTVAYVCRGSTCSAPITSLAGLQEATVGT